MRKKRLKALRTKILEKENKRCENTHPNYKFIRCEFSTEEWHQEHIGENGYFVWQDETRNREKRYLTE